MDAQEYSYHEECAVIWLRRDLRLDDNVALNRALASGRPILPVFIFDSTILRHLQRNDPRVQFIYERLKSIHEKLRKRGSGVLCLHGDPVAQWKVLIHTCRVREVYFNDDYEPSAIRRDEQVRRYLEERGIRVHACKDQLIFAPGEVLKSDGLPYTVYTPYKKRWLEQFKGPEAEDLATGQFFRHSSPFPSLDVMGFESSGIRVPDHDLSVVPAYHETRDLPAVSGTTRLGPHLRFGTIGIRRLISELPPNSEIFLSELIWREFFMQILYHYPHVVSRNFREKYDKVQWRNDEDEFKAWCRGETGYPLVDAGMRELNTTGFMHNRVRMVTASFLCKHLLIDWRWGEAYFAEKLLDYELSSNNGNWQWAAGTGCDAAPYFRVFNPETQQKKFDPKMDYIKKWVPEVGTHSYCQPIVEHRNARERALAAYQVVKL